MTYDSDVFQDYLRDSMDNLCTHYRDAVEETGQPFYKMEVCPKDFTEGFLEVQETKLMSEIYSFMKGGDRKVAQDMLNSISFYQSNFMNTVVLLGKFKQIVLELELARLEEKKKQKK